MRIPAAPRRTPEEIAADIAAMEEREQQRQVRKMLVACGVPSEHRAAHCCRPEHVPLEARAGWQQASDMIRGSIGRQFIGGLVGHRGTGKTTAATGVVMAEALQGRYARYTVAYDYLLAVREGRSFSSRVPESEVIRRHVAPRLLVIDEFHLQGSGESDDVAMKHLIQRRWDAQAATIIISNETPASFTTRVGQSIASRMRQHGGLMVCEWPDLRTLPKWSPERDDWE